MLPVYCQDGKRRYDPAGFKPESIMVTPEDARDFMRALDEPELLRDIGRLRFVAARSSCFQNIFREGAKSKTPRTITLWIEPVITFAWLARLQLDLEWPKECLGTESKKWEFDLVAHWPPKRRTSTSRSESRRRWPSSRNCSCRWSAFAAQGSSVANRHPRLRLPGRVP